MSTWHAAGERSGGRRCGFTLLEVTLAVVIAVGMLLVLLFFYQQAANLRVQLIEEAERVGTARLLMDRLTTELRCARWHGVLLEGLTGTSNSIRFVETELPSFSDWRGGRYGRVASPETDWKVVGYSLAGAGDGTNITGLMRSEAPLVGTLQPEAEDNFEFVGDVEATSREAPLTDQFRFLRFRYWDGTDWADTWNGATLPSGVEVSLGSEPLPEGVEPAAYPFELFRRVIFLPGSAASEELSLAEMVEVAPAVEEPQSTNRTSAAAEEALP